MDTFEKLKKSWWVLFPFTLLFPGFGFIYIGLKSSNKNWILEGITYEMPWVFYSIGSALFTSEVMAPYYVWLIILAAFIALIRSIMVAIKLFDVYDKNETPRISASVHSSPNSSSSTGNASTKKDKSNWSACCACLIAIFVIFAIISIL